MRWLSLLFVLPILLLVAGLLGNRPPLFSPPGPLERLKAYLTTNVAETRPDHPFPELRTPLLPADLPDTPVLRFRDDVRVRLEKAEGGTWLHARSASRIGKGDLAANARHLRDLRVEVERLVGEP